VIVHIGNFLDPVFLHAVGDRFDDVLADDVVRNLVDDDLLPSRLGGFLDVHLGAEGHLSAAGAVAVEDSIPPADHASRRKIRALDAQAHNLAFAVDFIGHQLGERDVFLVDDAHDRIADFVDVVRNEIARHPDGDAG
jgi:hypothetical protein